MKRRNTVLFTLLLAGLVPFAIRGCAAMLFVSVPAPVVGEERNFDITRSQNPSPAAPTGAVADARTMYAQAEKAVESFVRSLGKKARTDADRAALRELVVKAFEQRQELLRLELAEFQSRMNRLSQQLADRAEGREKVIDRRVDELLMPNLRWEEATETPAETPEKRTVAENAIEPSNQEPLSRNDRELLSLRKRVAFAAELQGLWLAMEQGRNGEITPFKTNFTLTFNEKQQYAFREGDAEPYSLGTYSLPEVASGLPFAALDLTRTYLRQASGPNQEHIEHAIVAIEGDTLRICSGGQRINDRPDDFTTAKDDGRLLMVYRRVSRKSPLGESFDLPVIRPRALQPGGSETPPGFGPGNGPQRNQTPIPENPLKTIEPPLPEDKGAAAELQKLFGFELKPVSGETIGIPPFRGGLQIVSLLEKSPAFRAGLRKDDVIIGAAVWETLSVEHLRYAYEHGASRRASHSEKGVKLFDMVQLYFLRTREKTREQLKVSVWVPKPDSLAPQVAPENSSSSTPTGSTEVGVVAKANEVQIQFSDPAGVTFQEDPLITFPCARNLEHSNIHIFELGKIPGHPNLRLSLALSVFYLVPEVAKFAKHNSIPVSLTPEDIERLAKGEPVKKALYVPTEDSGKLAMIDGAKPDLADPPHVEADKRGNVIVSWVISKYPEPVTAPAAGTDPVESPAQKPLVLLGHSDWVTGVAYSPDGKRIASSSRDKTARIWDAATGQELLTLRKGLSNDGHSGYVQSVTFSPNGKVVATVGGGDHSVFEWNAVSSGRALRSHVGKMMFAGAAYSPDGTRLAAGAYDAIKVWDTDFERYSSSEILSLNAEMVLSVAFSPDNKRLAAAGRDKKVRVFNSVTGEEQLAITEGDQVTCVVFSPDGTRLATAGPAGISVWDAVDGKILINPTGIKEISKVAYSRDGKRLASAGWDKVARVLDAANGKELLALKGHGNVIHGVAFSADGKRLVTGSEDRTVRIWDVSETIGKAP